MSTIIKNKVLTNRSGTAEMWEMFLMLFLQPFSDLERLYDVIIKNTNSGGFFANPLSPVHRGVTLGKLPLGSQFPLL